MRRRGSPGLLVGLTTLAVAFAGVALMDNLHRSQTGKELTERLRGAVDILAPRSGDLFALPSDQADAEIRRWAAASGLRVTLIEADGTVRADSWTLPALLPRLENHSSRPEVVAARSGDVGIDRRRSVTTDHPTTYVARMVGPAERPLGFLRLAQEETPQGWPWGKILLMGIAALVAGTLAHRWNRRYNEGVVCHLAAWTDLPASADLEAIAADVDRRFRTAREELTRELEATRAAMEQVAEGVVLVDREGIVRYSNAAAGTLLQSSLVPGRALVEAVRVPEVLGVVNEVLAHGGMRYTAVGIPDGPELAVRAAAVSHPVLAAAVVLADVRGEHQLERARRALVADLAHELRTPLTVLSGLAEELTESHADENLTAAMERQVARLRSLAEELEELARIESGQLKLHLEDIDAVSVARQVTGDFRTVAQGRGVAVTVVGGAPRMRTDPVRLAQVLTNLVDNGIRYNRAGGQVTVRIGAGEEGVRIEVEDTGVGIPASDVGLVFQRFYRVRRQAETEGGSGLGLAIVKHLVKALGGTVSLASRLGQGTTVTLLFPAVS